jgi:hypothetical protein
VNSLTRDEARDRSYFSLDDPIGKLTKKNYHDIGFDAGARWAIMAGSELSPYVSRFIEMLILVGIAENESITTPEQPPVPSDFANITPQIQYWKERG